MPDACLDLSHLRWFVVDEADRLLTQSYHRWLEVMDRASSMATVRPQKLHPGGRRCTFWVTNRVSKPLLEALLCDDDLGPTEAGAAEAPKATLLLLLAHGAVCHPCSAAAALCALPAGCEAFGRVVSAGPGPGHGFKQLAEHCFSLVHHSFQHQDHILETAENAKVLVFCQSVNTTHRLARLLQICCSLRAKAFGEEAEEEEVTEDEVQERRASSATVAEFSSSLTPKERSKVLRSFAKGQLRCLVCPLTCRKDMVSTRLL